MQKSLHAWIVGSQVGFDLTIDDCIIHGVFLSEGLAEETVKQLQADNPGDAYAITHIDLNQRTLVGFTMTGVWKWYLPQRDVSECNSMAESTQEHLHEGVTRFINSAPNNVW